MDTWQSTSVADRDATLFADAFAQPSKRTATRSRSVAWSTAAKAMLGVGAGLMLLQLAEGRSPPSGANAGSIGPCSPFGSWSFDDGFDAMVAACCKQVNPLRSLFTQIAACGPSTQPALSDAGIFAGSIGAPSDCPSANVEAVYTGALYVSEVVSNSTAFQCLIKLFQNPGQGAI